MGVDKKTALVIIDMQNAFCAKRGSSARRGMKALNINAVISNIKKVISVARSKGWPVIFTRLAFNSDYSDAGLLIKRSPQIRELHAYEENSWDSQIIRELSLKKDDIILTKKRYDGFMGTGLEKILKRNKVNRLIVGGILTNVCVESMVRSAFDRGFETTVISDMVSSYSKNAHQNALRTMKRHFSQVTSTKLFLET